MSIRGDSRSQLPEAAATGYDARGNRTERPEHWKEKDLVETRAYFRTITEPATLSIDNIEERDEGDYRCRVDFRKSPTRNTKVKLTVMGGATRAGGGSERARSRMIARAAAGITIPTRRD
ncbi:hypothetical protein B566_EDAN008860 [Ephemera danica]|nr:hypothetical protein B566_EDAN008860 [Ephemera danica]